MPLTQTQEDAEHRMRIESMRADIELKNEQTRYEPWKLMASLLSAAGIVIAGVFGALGYMLGLLHH